MPSIRSFSVITDQPVYALDTIHFSLDVYSDVSIESAKLYLKNDEGQLLLTHIVSGVEGLSLTIENGSFILSRKDLKSSIYAIELIVVNKNGVAKTSVNQPVNAIDPEVVEQYLIMHDDEYETIVAFVDDEVNITAGWMMQGDFLDAAIDCDDDLLFTIGKESGSLICRNLEENYNVWMYDAVHNPPFPYFQAFAKSENMIWVALYQNNILGFDNSGIEKYRAWLTHNKFPESMLITDKYLVVEEYSMTTMKKVMSSWYMASGVLNESQETPFSDMLLIGNVDDEILYAGVADGVSKFYAHDLTMSERRWLFDEEEVFYLSCNGSDGCYFLASETAIFTYCPEYSLVRNFDVGEVITSITYEHLSNTLWITTVNSVLKYDMRDNILENSNTFDASPDKVIIRYNRNLFDSEL